MRVSSGSAGGASSSGLGRSTLTLVLTLSLLAGALAGSAAAASEAVQVRVTTGSRARIVEGGAAARIQVEGICTRGAEVIEAFVYITQNGHTSSFGFIPLICDGTRHEWLVEVQAFDRPFHAGPATASPYALVEDPGTRETADDSRFLRIRMVV